MNNETTGKSGKKILLAEDDPDVREMLAFALRHAGHVVTLAENGKEALRLCSANNYDLIITDILMPKGDGFKVIRKLKKSSPISRSSPFPEAAFPAPWIFWKKPSGMAPAVYLKNPSSRNSLLKE